MAILGFKCQFFNVEEDTNISDIRNRAYLKAGFILKPEGTYASMAGRNQYLIHAVWNIVNVTEGKIVPC